jgi:hypothetical protein
MKTMNRGFTVYLAVGLKWGVDVMQGWAEHGAVQWEGALWVRSQALPFLSLFLHLLLFTHIVPIG